MTAYDYGPDAGGGDYLPDAPDRGGGWSDLKAALGKRLGPFTIGAWLLVVGGGVALAWSIRNLGAKQTDAGEARPQQTDPYADSYQGSAYDGTGAYEPWTYYGTYVGSSEDNPLYVVSVGEQEVNPPATSPPPRPCMYVPTNPGLPRWRHQTEPGRYYAPKAFKIMVVTREGKVHCQK